VSRSSEEKYVVCNFQENKGYNLCTLTPSLLFVMFGCSGQEYGNEELSKLESKILFSTFISFFGKAALRA
jgi:hypothetical protein